MLNFWQPCKARRRNKCLRNDEYLKLFRHFSCTYAKNILPLQQLLKRTKLKKLFNHKI